MVRGDFCASAFSPPLDETRSEVRYAGRSENATRRPAAGNATTLPHPPHMLFRATIRGGGVMSSGSAQIFLPADLLQEIDELVGIGARTEFITDLARREVHRLRLLQFLDEKPLGWDLEKHPELKDGAAQWVESIRRDEEPANGGTHRN